MPLLDQLNLRNLLFFMVGVPVVLLSAFVVAGVIGIAERAIEARLQDDIALISRVLEPLVAQRLERDDRAGVAESLQGTFDIGRVYGAAVYDRDGQLVARAGRADPDVTGSALASAAVASGEPGGRYRQVEERAVYSAFTPLFDQGGRILGLLQINRSRSEMQASLDRFRVGAWALWLLLASLVAVGIAFSYRQFIERPVKSLLGSMGAVRSGALDSRVRVTRPREFHNLAETFNSMLTALQHADRQRDAARERELTLQRELAESERIAEIGRMATGVAHELGAPLTVIAGRARRLRAGLDRDGGERGLRRIVDECRRMQAIVEQLLAYSRPGRAEHRLLDPAALAHTTLASLQEQAGAAGVAVDIRTPAGSAPALPRLLGDRVRLEVALNNLLRNAIRHARSRVVVALVATPVQDGERTQDCEGTQAREGVLFRVSDDGSGVAPEDEAHLFEAFFTRETTGRGTGLGLAIVARIAAEHEGSVHCEPGLLGGASFVLWVPVACGMVAATSGPLPTLGETER